MASRDKMMRDKMTEARKAAGLCLHGTCGDKAPLAPVFPYCEKHLREHPHLFLARGRRKKRLT